MQSTYLITLAGRADPVQVSTDQRDLFALRRRGWRELEYPTPEAALAVFSALEGAAAAIDNPEMLPGMPGYRAPIDTTAVGLDALMVITWMIYNAAHRDGITTSDFVTFAEEEMLSMSAGEETVPDPTVPTTSVSLSPG